MWRRALKSPPVMMTAGGVTAISGRLWTHIHMHPDVVLPADVGDGDEGVKGSVHRRPGGRAHKERHKALHGGKAYKHGAHIAQTSASG